MDTPTGTKSAQDVAIGQIVNYCLEYGPNAGEIRPAIVVKKFDPTTGNGQTDNSPPMVNLQVFTDGINDGLGNTEGGLLWKTSVRYSPDKEAGTWHLLAAMIGATADQATGELALSSQGGYDRTRTFDSGRTGLV